MFSEFLGSADEKEAVLCCHELSAPGFPPVLVQRGVLKMLDCLTERDQQVPLKPDVDSKHMVFTGFRFRYQEVHHQHELQYLKPVMKN